MTADERLEEIQREIDDINDWLWDINDRLWKVYLTPLSTSADVERVRLLQKRDALELERENILESQ